MKNTGIKLAIILMFFISACNSTPKGILPMDNMAAILVDLKLTEAKIENFLISNMDSTHVAYQYQQIKIFEKYNTDSVQFNKSYDYYLKNKEKMQKVYQKSLNILEDKNSKLSKELELTDELPGNNPHLQRTRKR